MFTAGRNTKTAFSKESTQKHSLLANKNKETLSYWWKIYHVDQSENDSINSSHMHNSPRWSLLSKGTDYWKMGNVTAPQKLSRLAWGGSSKVHLSVSIKNTPQNFFGSFIVWTQLRFWLQFLSKTNLITNRYFLKTLCCSGAVSTEKNFICLSWRRQSWRCLDFCWEWPGGTGSEMNITEDVESQGWGHVGMCRGGLEDILDKGC